MFYDGVAKFELKTLFLRSSNSVEVRKSREYIYWK